MTRPPPPDPLVVALEHIARARETASPKERSDFLAVAAWRLDDARGRIRDSEDAAWSEYGMKARRLLLAGIEKRRQAVDDAAAQLAELLAAH
jgi:hypothetical protein